MKINAEVDFGIKADNKTDNALGFIKMQEKLSKLNEHHDIYFRSGTILSSFNKWPFGLESFFGICSKTTFKSLYSGDDEAQKRAIFMGEMMQDNLPLYNGKKEYVTPDKIESACRGDKYVTRKEVGYIYKPGELIHINSFDLFSGGYPRAAKNFDWIEIEGIDGLRIYLKKKLRYNFTEAGNPIIFSLDREANRYCRLAKFKGATFVGNLAIPALYQHLIDCNIVDGWLWPGESKLVVYDNVYADNLEVDKLIDTAIFNNFKTPSSPSNGGSVNNIIMNYSTTDSIRLCPRYLTLNHPTITANKLPYISGIADPPARNPIRRYIINSPTFTEVASGADSNLEFAPHQEYILEEVYGNDIIIPNIELVATLDEGYTILNKADGTKSGKLIAINKYKDNKYRISGDWQQPIVSEKWKWSYIEEIIDLGGHIMKNDKVGYGRLSKRWQGNTSTGETKTMVLTQKDFTGYNPSIEMNAFVDYIEYSSKVANNLEMAKSDSDNPQEYGTIFKCVSQPTLSVEVKKWIVNIDLIGVGKNFTITVYWRKAV